MKAAQESQSLLNAETEEDTTENKETGHEKTDHIEDKLSTARGICSAMILCAFISLSAASVQCSNVATINPRSGAQQFPDFCSFCPHNISIGYKKKVTFSSRQRLWIRSWMVQDNWKSKCVDVHFCELFTSRNITITYNDNFIDGWHCAILHFLKEKYPDLNL